MIKTFIWESIIDLENRIDQFMKEKYMKATKIVLVDTYNSDQLIFLIIRFQKDEE